MCLAAAVAPEFGVRCCYRLFRAAVFLAFLAGAGGLFPRAGLAAFAASTRFVLFAGADFVFALAAIFRAFAFGAFDFAGASFLATASPKYAAIGTK